MADQKRKRGAPLSNDGRTFRLYVYVKPERPTQLDELGSNRSELVDAALEFAHGNGAFQAFYKKYREAALKERAKLACS